MASNKTRDIVPWTQAHNRQWYVWRIHWGKAKNIKEVVLPINICAVHCNFILQKKSISKWYLRYVKLIRYSLFRSVPILGQKNRIWGNYGILGKFVQIGIWCILIISSSWVSNRVNKLTVCLSSASIGFGRKMQISWGKPKIVNRLIFQKKKNILRAPRSFDGEKYIDVTLS